MKQDEELFALCKAVYEATGLKGIGRIYINKPLEKDDWIPKYTSDYLLEKLPPQYNDGFLTLGEAAGAWGAYYQHGLTKVTVIGDIADTPLKALLKLVLALHEAGEL